jgi:hypothetical protein
MEQDEIVRQIRGMHKAGIGGFFMHSRDGLETPYMGEEWFSMIRAAALEAEALGMEAWLYDEDRWPSGTAGGSVPAKWGDMAAARGSPRRSAAGVRRPVRRCARRIRRKAARGWSSSPCAAETGKEIQEARPSCLQAGGIRKIRLV